MQDHTENKLEGKTEGDDSQKIYEIGYLLISSIPAEKVADTSTNLKDILSKSGAPIISEEGPELRTLAYVMVKKIGPSNHRFDQAYFGWVKFELPTQKIEGVKKAFEVHPDMLRVLVMTTVRENTYLGKKIPAAATAVLASEEGLAAELPLPPIGSEEKNPVPPATLEEMDKSIDEMVKGA